MSENIAPESETRTPKSKRWGCLKIGLIVVVVLLVVLHFATPAIVKSAANRILPDALGTDAHLENVQVGLIGGRIGVGGLRIAQPEGFPGEPLLELGTFRTAVPLGKALRQNPLTIKRLHVDDLTLRLIQDAEGILNVTRLGPPPDEDVIEEPDPAEIPPVWIKHVLLENIRILFEAQNLEWLVEIHDLEFELRDLRIADTSGPHEPATFSGRLEIAGPEHPARLLLRGRVGPIHPEQPEQLPGLQLAVGLIGFNLDIIDPFLIRGARTTLGGSGLDFTMFLEIGPPGGNRGGNRGGNGDGERDGPESQSLYGSYLLSTDQGHAYAGELGGTVAQPHLPFLNLLGDIVGNQFGRITRLGGNVAEGGLEAARAAFDTGASALRGAADTARGAAGGIFRTARGVVTLDREEAVGGIRDTTVGTVTNVTGTVTSTVGTAASGLGRVANTALGYESVAAWWADLDNREELFLETAEEFFENRPFPQH